MSAIVPRLVAVLPSIRARGSDRIESDTIQGRDGMAPLAACSSGVALVCHGRGHDHDHVHDCVTEQLTQTTRMLRLGLKVVWTSHLDEENRRHPHDYRDAFVELSSSDRVVRRVRRNISETSDTRRMCRNEDKDVVAKFLEPRLVTSSSLFDVSAFLSPPVPRLQTMERGKEEVTSEMVQEAAEMLRKCKRLGYTV